MNGVDVFFRLINFGIFLALVAYYVKKSLLPNVRSRLAHKKAVLKDLDEQMLEVNGQHAKLEEQLKRQDALYQELQSKVEHWKAGVLAEETAKKSRSQAEAEADAHRLKKQRASYERAVVMRLVPEVYDASVHELEELLSDPQRAEAYNDKAIRILSQVKHGA